MNIYEFVLSCFWMNWRKCNGQIETDASIIVWFNLPNDLTYSFLSFHNGLYIIA
jgi:hypothetical protein